MAKNKIIKGFLGRKIMVSHIKTRVILGEIQGVEDGCYLLKTLSGIQKIFRLAVVGVQNFPDSEVSRLVVRMPSLSTGIIEDCDELSILLKIGDNRNEGKHYNTVITLNSIEGYKVLDYDEDLEGDSEI